MLSKSIWFKRTIDFFSVINDTITDIDITSQPVGIYILIIELNNAESEWKIVKE